MAGQRQPIELLAAKGKKHLTKAEIEERMRTEVKAPADKVTAPAYLTAEQKKSFKKVVKELQKINVVANLDVDALARLVIAQSKYIQITEELEKQPLMVEIDRDTGRKDASGDPIFERAVVVNGQIERLAIMQDRYFRQCRQGAADFGMTVSSRCRLVVPDAKKDQKPENKFVQRFG